MSLPAEAPPGEDQQTLSAHPNRLARTAGALYLVIIVCGLFAEIVVRSRLIESGDPATTAANIAASLQLFRIGIVSDVVMVVADVALAIVLYQLLRPVSVLVSLLAATFRLIQAAVLATNLLNLVAVDLLHSSGRVLADGVDLGMLYLDAHRYGFDLGLIFFGISCAFLGYLFVRSGYVPRLIGFLVWAAAAVYLIGSFLLFLAPDWSAAFQPVYGVAALAEITLCLWLLVRGVKAPSGDFAD